MIEPCVRTGLLRPRMDLQRVAARCSWRAHARERTCLVLSIEWAADVGVSFWATTVSDPGC